METMTDTETRKTHPTDGPVHGWFSLSYSNYLVLPRTLMQSMPIEWQERLTDCLDEMHDAFDHIEQAAGYNVEAATHHEVCDLTDEQRQQLGIVEDWYRGETPPEGLDEQDLAEWQNENENPDGVVYYRNGEELEPGEYVTLPVSDPVPHYNRGRTYIRPLVKPDDNGIWTHPETGQRFNLGAEYLLEGQEWDPKGTVWKYFGEFSEGVPVLLEVKVGDDNDIDRSARIDAGFKAA